MAIKRNQDQQDERELKGQPGASAEAIQRQRNVNAQDEKQDREDKAQGKLTAELAEPHKGETKYFEGSVTKIDKEGRTVMSDHLEEGDRLRRETTDRYKASGLDPAADQ